MRLQQIEETSIPKQEPPVWNLGTTLGFGLAITAVWVGAQSWVTSIWILQLIFTNLSNLSQLSDKTQTAVGLWTSIATIFSAPIGLSFIALFIKFRKGPTITNYLGLRMMTRNSIIVLAFLAVAFGLTSFSTELLNSRNSGIDIHLYKTSVLPALVWIAGVVFAPAFEEALFRGFLFVGIKQSRLGPIGAILLTSIAWAALHTQYDLWGIGQVFISGIVLGFVRLRTNSLWSTLLLHMVWNFAAFLRIALYLNGISS